MSTPTHTHDGIRVNPERYWYSVWGKKPGWGYASGWCFGKTPALAMLDALRDAAQWQASKFACPVNVYLKTDLGEHHSFTQETKS